MRYKQMIPEGLKGSSSIDYMTKLGLIMIYTDNDPERTLRIMIKA